MSSKSVSQALKSKEMHLNGKKHFPVSTSDPLKPVFAALILMHVL